MEGVGLMTLWSSLRHPGLLQPGACGLRCRIREVGGSRGAWLGSSYGHRQQRDRGQGAEHQRRVPSILWGLRLPGPDRTPDGRDGSGDVRTLYQGSPGNVHSPRACHPE